VDKPVESAKDETTIGRLRKMVLASRGNRKAIHALRLELTEQISKLEEFDYEAKRAEEGL